jgi:hypothetical protein
MRTTTFFFSVIFVLVTCSCSKKNSINFYNDIFQVRKSLERTSLLFKQINSRVEAIEFDSNYIYFTGGQLSINDTIRNYPFEKITTKEFKDFTTNLKFLFGNNIIAIKGPLRTGLTTFGLKHGLNDEFRDLRYIALDSGNLNLDHTGLMVLDKKSSIVLLTNMR